MSTKTDLFLPTMIPICFSKNLCIFPKTDPLLRKYFFFTQNCSTSQQITTKNDPYFQTITFSKKWSISTKTNMLLHKWIRSKKWSISTKIDPVNQKLIQSTKNWSSQPKLIQLFKNQSVVSPKMFLFHQKLLFWIQLQQ